MRLATITPSAATTFLATPLPTTAPATPAAPEAQQAQDGPTPHALAASAVAATAPLAHGGTLIGPLPILRVAPVPVAPQVPVTPSGGMAALGTKSLREAYPTIHRLPPSPTRPVSLTTFERPVTPTNAFYPARAARRAALVRGVLAGLALALALALAVAAGMVIAGQL